MTGHGTPLHLASLTGPAAAPTCRICWEGDDNPATSPLLSKTCSCAGSLAHIHARCLLQWQRLAADPHTCATCKGPVTVPAAVAARVRLPPRWLAWLQQQAELAKRNPWKELFKWWHRGVGCMGVLYAAAYSRRAVVEAPGVAVHIRDLPLRQARWQLLAGAAAASVLQQAWLPWLETPQRMLRLHSLCYAGGVFLDLAGLHLGQALAGASALGSMAAPVATGVCKTVTFAGVALQMAAVQHLHPLQQLLSGYWQGASAACGATGQLLLRPARAVLGLLGCGDGGAVGQLVHATTRMLPFTMHSVAHSLALAGCWGL